MRNAGLEEAQAAINIAGRNINKLRYADDTTIMAQSEEELKSLLMKLKEESENVGLKLNIQKAKIMASGPIISWELDGDTMAEFIFLGSKITADGDCSHEIKGRLLLGSRVMTNLDSILKSRESVGEGGVIWEYGVETCTISYMKKIASPGSMHDTGCLGLVHWGEPEGWYEDGGGRGVHEGEHMYTCGRFMWKNGKTNTIGKVISLLLK